MIKPNKVVNIGILCTSMSWGGLEINTFKLACWLKQRGYTVHVYGKNKNTPLVTHCSKAGITTHSIGKKLKYGDLVAIWRLHSLFKKTAIKLVFVVDSKDIYLAISTKMLGLNTLKVVYQQHMYVGVNKKDSIHTFMYQRLFAWISPLPQLKENTLSKTKIQPDRIHVIPLCINTEYFASARQHKAAARQSFGIGIEKTVVGVIGRLDPGKNQAVLIRAVYELKKQDKIIYALIVGEESRNDPRQYREELIKLAKKLNVAEQVHFIGYRANPLLAFACLDIFAMCSNDETFGTVTIEAMACRLPILGAKTGGTQAIISHRQNGLYFEPNNEQDLAEKILTLLNNQRLTSQIAAKAQKEAQQKYSHHILCDKIEELICAAAQ